MSGLKQQLQAQPWQFDLFQVVSLLQRSRPQAPAVGTSFGLDEAVRLSARVSLAFEPSDVSELAGGDDPQAPWTVRTPILSLAGVQGPLPWPLTELLLERSRDRDRAGLDFLDIFNQRLLALFYRARQKHRLSLQTRAVDAAPLIHVLHALAGQNPQGESVWLRHTALQAMAPRSMASLLGVLSDCLGLPLQGRQFVGGWQVLPRQSQARLGRPRDGGCPLGAGRVLGQRVWDQEAAIEIRPRDPLCAEVFADLLPGGQRHQRMQAVVSGHLQRELQVLLSPMPMVTSRVCLGGGRSGRRLGHDSWLGQGGVMGRPCWVLRAGPAGAQTAEVGHGH